MEKIRKSPEKFTIVRNDVLTDARLSLKAKGLYAYLYSKPNDWEFHIKAIRKELKESRDAIYSAIRELIYFGYIRRYQVNDNGFGGTVYEFLEACTENTRPCTENPYTENPYTENPHTTNTDITNTDITKEKEISKEISKKKRVGCRFENSEFCSDVAPDEFVSEAERTNPNVDPFDQYLRFKDYWTSKSGKDATKLDWLATWRNWLRNAYPAGNRSGSAKQKSAAELFADMTNW